MRLDEQVFRYLVMAFYRRLRRGGLTRLDARELVGSLVNTAYDLELFDFQVLLKDQERVQSVISMLAPDLANWNDWRRQSAARAALPHLLKASDGYAQLLLEKRLRATSTQRP